MLLPTACGNSFAYHPVSHEDADHYKQAAILVKLKCNAFYKI